MLKGVCKDGKKLTSVNVFSVMWYNWGYNVTGSFETIITKLFIGMSTISQLTKCHPMLFMKEM